MREPSIREFLPRSASLFTSLKFKMVSVDRWRPFTDLPIRLKRSTQERKNLLRSKFDDGMFAKMASAKVKGY